MSIIAKILYCLGFKPNYSTGICGRITVGYGRLGPNGYWKYMLRFEEYKPPEKKRIIILVKDGCVRDVSAPDDYEVYVHDYDTDGSDERLLKTDSAGAQYDELRFQ